MTAELIRRRLLALADEGNARFAASLIPGLEPTRILGCRNPALRALAKELCKTEPEAVEVFLAKLPHELHDEDMLHAFLLGLETKPDLALAKTQSFLPHVKNWAVCDALSPKGFTKDLGRLELEAKRWLASEHTYTCRFGICMHMTHFLGETFRPEFLALIGSLDSEEYYVHMAQGWYFATALAKQPEAALPWLVEDRLPTPVRRKAIQKSIESFRVPDETKTVLRRVRESLPRRGGEVGSLRRA
ncbi:DNA alkylation repair protein [Schaalia cardiffensis]|uniref:DNA alkylation repair protein n=1 Tax=Schaalia cardiffensis TaxID=181487 RepID=UPI0018E6FE21|nr:DNA alkylation repair protein [Schaalia cardiffensis]MBJ2329452.1 DNA alkylation repair protein [Schaalia cardiffensis]